MRDTLAELQNSLPGLREAVERLNVTVADQEQRQADLEQIANDAADRAVEANELARKAAETARRRHEATRNLRRSIAAVLIGLLVVIALVAWSGRRNVETALTRQRHDVLVCFLRPGAVTDQIAKDCDAKFSSTTIENGRVVKHHEYLKLQESSQGSLADFLDLKRWAVERGWVPPSAWDPPPRPTVPPRSNRVPQ